MRRLHFLIAILINLLVNQLQAGALLGADVRYRYLSGKKYEVCIALYRDCRGIPLSNPNNVYVYNDSFQIPLSLTRVKIEEVISPQCTGACVSNTTSGQGTEKHTYLDTIDFASGVYQKFGTQSRPLVYFAFDQCCRNGGITTYPPGNMFVEAMLNLYAANQNSVVVGFNDFNQSVEAYLYCQQTHNYSYRSNPYQTNDSLIYDMVRAKDDKTSEINYDPYKPMTYYCNSNPGNTNCLPNTTVNPVRGFFFNRSNGNLICTPGKCDELGTIVCKVGLYKKIGQSFVLMGYMKRDCNFIVISNMGDNIPYLLKNKDYPIKAREKFCVDMPIKDDKDVLQSQADTVFVSMLKSPTKGSLTLLDSNAREKTLRYCWTPSDQDYLKKRTDEIEFRASQKKCLKLKVTGISTTIQFSVIAPDSICQVKVRTFEDRNKNGIKDGTEVYSKAKFFMDTKSIYTIYETDSLGQLILNPFYGKLTFGIPSQLERYSDKSDKVVQTYFDSTYTIDLPYNKRYGLKGKVFVDVNSNCVFDAGDYALANEKVLLQNKQVLAISDKNGDYFIQSQTGSDVLKIKSDAYNANCSASYNIQMKADTVQLGFDFPLSPKSAFKDLSVEFLSKPHLQQNQVLSQNIKVSNKGFKTEKNVLLGLNTSQRLFDFKSSKTTYKSADTLFWIIDSIPANSSVLIPFDFRVYKDSFLSNSLMCYSAFLRADSVVDNNQFKICEVFTDTVLAIQYKSSMNMYKVQEQDRRMTYKVSFSDKNYSHTYLVLYDSLDASKFDLTSFKLMNNPNGFKVNLIDHVLYAEYYGSISAGTELGFVYSIDLKPGFKSAFMVYNAANWFVDNNTTPQRTRTVNETESAIKIGLINDSDYCLGDLIYLPVSSLYEPNSNFKVYLSDSLGSFNNQTLILDTLVSKRNNVLTAKIPYTMNTGKGYKLKVVSDNPNTQSFEADFTQNLSFYGLPSVALSSNLVNGKICANDTLKFFATGADSFVYLYNTYQLGQFSKNKTSFTFVPSSNGKLQVATRDLNACIAFSNEISFAINALPNVKLLSNKELCAGGQLDLDLTGANTYTLFQNGLFLAGNLNSGIRKSPVLNANTGYKLIGRDANNCVNTDSVFIVVNPLPFKPVIYANKNYLQSNYSTGNQWFTGSVKIDSATAQTFYPPVNGSYAVEYTNNKGCKAISDVYDFRYYSLTSIDYSSVFKVYPNPSSGLFIFENLSNDILNIQVIGSDGKLVYTQDSLQAGLNTIDLHGINSGLFVLKIYLNGGIFYSKIQVLQ